MNFWDKHQGAVHITHLQAEPFRVVESQITLTSRNLVDTTEEHDILENMLEASKPKVDTRKHYLLFTPFRYPPLQYGSRFGGRFEKSLWYGSLDIETALSEVAYYRLLFLRHTEADLGFINVPLTSFNAHLKTNQGIDLCKPPFNADEKEFSSKTDYTNSQLLGSQMRNAGVQAFIFRSVRSLKQGRNMAAFTPAVFHTKNHQYIFNVGSWHCVATKNSVDFSNQDRERFNFVLSDF